MEPAVTGSTWVVQPETVSKYAAQVNNGFADLQHTLCRCRAGCAGHDQAKTRFRKCPVYCFTNSAVQVSIVSVLSFWSSSSAFLGAWLLMCLYPHMCLAYVCLTITYDLGMSSYTSTHAFTTTFIAKCHKRTYNLPLVLPHTLLVLDSQWKCALS